MKKTDFIKLVSGRVLILDGAMGTELQKRGYLSNSGAPEEMNLSAPEKIQEIQRDYLEAGSDIVIANTFGANRLKLEEYNAAGKLDAINRAGVAKTKEIALKYGALTAADIGPIGSYLAPLGKISFDEAYEVFSEQVRSLAKEDPDLVIIETMAEIREVKAALLAVKDNFSGPVIVQMTFTQDGTTVTGTDVLSFLSVAEGMGADGIGMNCSVGPKDLVKFAGIMAKYTDLPISFKPNAGMPRLINRQTVFPGTVEEFTEASEEAFNAGATMLGGCCGTTPEYIRALAKKLKNRRPAKRVPRDKFLLSSRTKTIDLFELNKVFKVGERINPTNRKKFQEELFAGSFAYIRREAQEQANSGADILDINMGLPGADELALMSRAVDEVQEAVSAPLCLDSSSHRVLEEGLKICAGKPIINSVNGDMEKLDQILPLAKRFGAAVIGLAIDENGIPKTVQARLVIAERIISKAKEYGIDESEVIIDYLALSASAMADQSEETLKAIVESKKKWPRTKTILGISNISFGLPNRQAINSTFLKLAVSHGLDMAILNPHEDWDIDDKYAKALLTGNDSCAMEYINQHSGVVKPVSTEIKEEMTPEKKLYTAILEGGKENITSIVDETLASGKTPLEIANDILLKALNEVGDKFNRKEYFLPQVIRSAEASQIAFGKIKPLLKKAAGFNAGRIVMATVKGDVHDIGKNIVISVLESHGWEVIDLGKNADAETIVETARKEGCILIGISALMTTTMLEMENVVRARNAAGIKVKIIVGGAPVTQRFATEIGADAYAKDAVEAARIAESLK